MTTVEVRKLYEARPFKPFVLHLADGRRVRVTHPEWMAFSPSGRTVTVYRRDDSSDVIDLLLITRLHVPANNRTAARK